MFQRYQGLSLLTLLVLAGSSLAEELRGVITKVDLDNQQVVVEGRGRGLKRGMYTFSLGKNASIMIGRKAAEPASLQPGRRVRVFYDMDEDRRVITAIHIHGARVTTGEDRGLTGTVRSVHLKERKLVIQTNGPKGKTEVNLELPAKFTVTYDGKPVETSELKKGVLVRIVPEKRDGKMIAKSIELVDEEPGFIARIRQALKIADLVLQMAEKK